MNGADMVDQAKGWFSEDGVLAAFAKISRPLAVTMTVTILPVGGAMVGIASIFNPAIGLAMAKNSVAFFAGLPEALYWMVGGIATGYFGAKAYETKSAPPPIGRPSPEAPVPVKPDPSMPESDIAAADYSRSTIPADQVRAAAGLDRLPKPAFGFPAEDATMIDRRTFEFDENAGPETKPAVAGETPELQL